MTILAKLKEEPEIFIVIAAWLVIGGTYSALSLYRFFTFHAGVYDLGVSYELIYSVFHGLIGHGTLGDYQIQKPIYLVLAPFFGLTGEIPFLLVFQSLWIFFGSIPLYFISRKFGHGPWISTALSLSFLFYYPLGGVAWFDFHFMAIFPTFFFLFYCFYLYGHKRASFAFAILAMATDFLVPAIIGLGAIIILIAERKEKGWKNSFAMGIIVISIAIYIAVIYLYSFGEVSQYTNNRVIFSVNFSGLFYFYPLYLLIPVLFLALLAPEYMILSLPFFFFIYSNNYEPYFSLMFYQYPALIAPVLFISASKGLVRFGKAIRNRKVIKSLATFMLVFNVILFSFLTPIGNLFTAQYDQQIGQEFTGLPYSYDTGNQITPQQYDSYLRQAISMIPRGSSVMIQDNMPQLSYLYNWTLPENINYSYLPTYALLDPYAENFIGGSFFGSNLSDSAYGQANRLINDYGYGIFAELDGIVILERNYTGTFSYVGMNEFFNPSSFDLAPGSFSLPQSEYIPPINDGGAGFYGPYTFLSPGTYNITFEIYSPQYSGNQSLRLQLTNTSYDGLTIDYQLILNSTYFGSGSQSAHFVFSTSDFLSLVEFRAFYLHMVMPLIFTGVQVTELSG